MHASRHSRLAHRPFVAVCAMLAALSGCTTYREFNDERRGYSFTNDAPKWAKVDLVAAIDPLGLGDRRLANQTLMIPKVIGDDGQVEVDSSGKPVFEAVNRGQDQIENALQGFYDPSYPQKLCAPLVSAYTVPDHPAEDYASVCRGFSLLPAAPDPNANRPLFSDIIVTTTAKTEQEIIGTKGLIRKVTYADNTDVKRTRTPVADPPFLVQFQTKRRNDIQDRLIQASDFNCELFKDDLFLFRSDIGFWLTSATITLGAAGAIVTNGLSQLFSAASAVTAGTAAAFDKTYFQEKAMPVLLKSIDVSRATVRDEILKKRTESIDKYTLSAAIDDSFRYHQACTLRNGLDTAEDTLTKRLQELEGDLKKRLAPGESETDASADGATPAN